MRCGERRGERDEVGEEGDEVGEKRGERDEVG